MIALDKLCRDTWKTPWIVASMWHCVDEECNCYQPQIDLVTPGVGYPWVKRYEIWRGTFISDPYPDERMKQQDELREAAAKFKIELDESCWEGLREATREEIDMVMGGRRDAR